MSNWRLYCGVVGCVGGLLACSSTSGSGGSNTNTSSSGAGGATTGTVHVGTGSSSSGSSSGGGTTGSSGGTGTTGASSGGGTTTGSSSGGTNGCTTGATVTPADDAGIPPGDCSDSGWCVHSPQPYYTGVWGFGPNDIWAVQGNAVRHWDGAKWTIVFGGGTPYINDAGVSVGGDVPTLGGIWGSSDSDIWVGVSNTGGELFHWDGQNWSIVSTADPFYYPVVWGAAANDIWAGGNELSHWNGCVWSQGNNPVPPGDVATAIWGSSGSDVWAVGQGGSSGGLILHWDGVSWVRATNPPGVDGEPRAINAVLSGVWGSGPHDVWAVGDDQTGKTYGTILHYDGVSWQSASVPAVSGPALPTTLRGVWGSGASDVWAFGGQLNTGGSGSVLLHYDGVSWSVAPNPFSGADAQREFFVGWGSGPSDVYAFGAVGTIVHYDGSAWSYVADATGDNFTGVWGAASNDVWAASTISGSNGGEIFHWDGNAWSTEYVTDGGHPGFQSMSGSGANDVWIASTNGGAWRWDGASWTFVGNGIALNAFMMGVWVESAANRWLVGSQGLVYQNSGDAGWVAVANPADGTAGGFLGSGQLNAVWGISGQVYAVGTSHFGDGGVYNTILRGAASGGALLDISQPEGNPLTPFTSLNAIGGASAQDLWAVGSVMFHYLSGTWTEVTPPAKVAGATFYGVWGQATDDLWIVGSDPSNFPVLLHWDGSGLAPATTPHRAAGLGANAIYGFGARDVWFVGRNGAIEHLE